MSTDRFPNGAPLLHDYLHESAQRAPEKVALVCGTERWTYRQLDEDSNALAWALCSLGVLPGDRVLVVGENTAETCIAFWGVLKANAVVSILNPQTKPRKLAYIVNDCRPAALIVAASLLRGFVDVLKTSGPSRATIAFGSSHGELSSAARGCLRLEELHAANRRDLPPLRRRIDIDLASIIYTSGSTGDSKGVMHTHLSMRAAACSVSTYLEANASDVMMNVLPLAFDYGLYQMIMAFRVGARLVLERSFAYPASVLERIGTEHVTAFPGVPTIFALLSNFDGIEEFDLGSVRYVTNTAATLSRKNVEAIRRIFPNARIYSMYGLTECKRVSFLPPEELERHPDSVGYPIPNTEIWIAGPDGNRLAPGEIGEIVVRGSTVMLGYWEKPEASRRKLRPGALPGERVLYSGDLGRIDVDGRLYFVGRTDDVIKSRGEKVPPREVEHALVEVVGVREAAVVGVPDPLLGEAPVAFVVVDDCSELSPQALYAECRSRLEAHMIPRDISIVESLPKTPNGKIDKLRLRSVAASGAALE